MVEARYVFPICGGMTLLAVFPKPPLVLIGMTCDAVAWKSQVGAGEVLHFDYDFVCDLHARRCMTLCAG